MINTIIAEVFDKIGHVWMLDTGLLTPEEDDVQIVLDKAAELLYDEDLHSRLETGGLIIEKTESGHDVYVYVGNYQ
jgi:hypothetical protein